MAAKKLTTSKKSTTNKSAEAKIRYLKEQFPNSKEAKKQIDYITKEFAPKAKKINPLDAAISKGKSLPSKNKKYPGDSDVGIKGFKKKPVIKVKKK